MKWNKFLPMMILAVGLLVSSSVVAQVAEQNINLTTALPAVISQPQESTPAVTASAGNVLWDLTHGVYLGYEPNNRYSTLRTALQGAGYTVTTTTNIGSVDLSPYKVLVVCLASAWNSAYTASERTKIQTFVNNGGGLFIMGDNTYVANSNINSVAQLFGVTLGISTLTPNDLYITNLTSHAIFNGVTKIYFIAAGEITASSPASIVAREPGNKGVVAVAQSGSGKVVVTGDLNFCENNYIANEGNQKFGVNIFDWLSGGSGWTGGKFDFNDGTAQGWTMQGAYDEDGDGPFTSNFSFNWWDQVNHPNTPFADPLGDKKGSIMIFTPSAHGINNPTATWWIMQYHSPDLSASTTWQNAKGYTIELCDAMSAFGTLYSNQYVVVYDLDQSRDRYFYSGTAQAIQHYSTRNWNHFSFDWSGVSTFPTHYILKEVFVNLWGKMSDGVDGAVFLDEVIPIGGVVQAPDITVNPTSFNVTLAQGQQTTRTLTIGNVGNANLTYNISISGSALTSRQNWWEIPREAEGLTSTGKPLFDAMGNPADETENDIFFSMLTEEDQDVVIEGMGKTFNSPTTTTMGLTWDGSNLWVVSYSPKTIYKISAADGHVITSFAAPGNYPTGLGWDGNYLWYTDSDGPTIYKLNPSTGAVITSFTAPGACPQDLAWDGGYLWNNDTQTHFSSATPDRTFKVNVATHLAVATFNAIGNFPTGMAWDGAYLWTSDNEGDKIYKVNPSTFAILYTTNAPGTYPNGLTFDGQYLWCSDNETDKIYQLDISIAPTWISVNPTSGTVTPGGSRNLTVTINAGSLTPGTYHANIIINSNDPDESSVTVPVTLTVTSGPNLSVTPNYRDVGAAAGTTTFSVANTGSGTMSWTASVTSGSSWLSITSGSSGTNSGTITASFTANTGAARVGKITVTATGATGSPKTVEVRQAAAQPVLSVTPNNRDVPSTAGTTTFSVANTGGGTMSWTAAVTSGASWLSISSGSSGTNSGTITAAYMANPGAGTRVGTITVTASGATGSPKQVTVTQSGSQPAQTTVKIDPASKTIRLNNTGEINVVIESVTNLGSFEFEIDFNGTIVNVANNSDVQMGPFLGSTGRTVIPVGPNINNSAGTLVFGAATIGTAAGPNGNGTLATIKWTGKAEGTTTLDLKNVKVSDINGIVIPVNEGDGEIIVKKGFWADVNEDGKVDIIDIQLVAAHWNTHVGDPNYDPQYDVDNEGQGDGDIDIVDIQLVASWWNQPIPPLAASNISPTSKAVHQSAILKLAPIFKGDLTLLEISVEGAINLGGFQCDLTSSRTLSLKSLTSGEFLSRNGNTVVALGPQVSQSGHCATVGAFNYGEYTGVSGSGVLAQIAIDELLPIQLENIQLVDMEGYPIIVSSIIDELSDAHARPQRFALHQNYPNPFNPETAIRFDISGSKGDQVKVMLYISNVQGQKVCTLIDGEKAPGTYEVIWDGHDDSGAKMTSGLYFYTLTAGDYKATKKMAMMK